MSTIVFHGLQSCLEPQSMVAEPRTLRLRLSAPKPSHQFPTHSLELSLKPTPAAAAESGGWSFVQALSDPTSPSPILKPAAASPYAAKRSLSDKSLQLCTENLGSETGSDSVSATDDGRNYLFSPSPPSWEASQPESNSPTVKEESRPAAVCRSYKRSRSGCCSARRDFPPPLTTMSGPELVRVRRPHREDGRLVIEAVKTQSRPSCFEAERIDGRLRLYVAAVKDSSEFDSSSSVTASEKIAEGNGEAEEEEEEILIREGEGEGEIMVESKKNNRNSNTAWRCIAEGGHYGKNANDGKGLFNWEPFWAATASLQV